MIVFLFQVEKLQNEIEKYKVENSLLQQELNDIKNEFDGKFL